MHRTPGMAHVTPTRVPGNSPARCRAVWELICNRTCYADDTNSTIDPDGTYVTVALGNTWSHCVNTRLIFQYLDDVKRQV